MTQRKYKFLGRYSKDKMAKITAGFLLVFGAVWIGVWPGSWPFVVGYFVIVMFIAYMKRNSP